jgi:hypothetical protein
MGSAGSRSSFNDTLMHGMLGALLFACALHVQLDDLREQRVAVAALALVGKLARRFRELAEARSAASRTSHACRSAAFSGQSPRANHCSQNPTHSGGARSKE